MTLLRAASLAAVGLLALAAYAAPVKVTGGEVVGVQADTLKTYLGIPYAAPPVGELRWRAPQAVVPWKGVKEARSFAPACAQSAPWVTMPKSEDCLYLNIWAPEKASKLPVIVWFHGGGYYGALQRSPASMAPTWPSMAPSSSRSTIASASSVSLRIRNCRPSRPTGPPATRASWTRSPRCAG